MAKNHSYSQAFICLSNDCKDNFVFILASKCLDVTVSLRSLIEAWAMDHPSSSDCSPSGLVLPVRASVASVLGPVITHLKLWRPADFEGCHRSAVTVYPMPELLTSLIEPSFFELLQLPLLHKLSLHHRSSLHWC